MNTLQAAILVMLAACSSTTSGQQPASYSHHADQHRSLAVVAVNNANQFADTVLSVSPPPKNAPAINANDYARITEAITRTNEVFNRVKVLMNDERTMGEGRELLNTAHQMFHDIEEMIRGSTNVNGRSGMLRRKYANHDLEEAHKDEERALDVARQVVRHLYQHELGTVSFPECVEKLVQSCRGIITRYLRTNGLESQIDIHVYKKRPKSKDPVGDKDGYNKVVIVTDSLGEVVAEIPEYPYDWNGIEVGPWGDCVSDPNNGGNPMTKEDCCLHLRTNVASVMNDAGENEYEGPPGKPTYIECAFFTPSIGIEGVNGTTIHYPEVSNAVIMYESLDGRVQERPFIQTDLELPQT